MVNAASHQLQVVVVGVGTCAWHVQVRESPMDMKTRLLAEGCGPEYPDQGDFVHCAGPEIRVAGVQALDGSGSVPIYGDHATAEGAGGQGGGGGGGGA